MCSPAPVGVPDGATEHIDMRASSHAPPGGHASSHAPPGWHAALASYNAESPASPAPVGEADGATEHVDMSASPHASPGWHAALASYNVELPASPAPVGEADPCYRARRYERQLARLTRPTRQARRPGVVQ